MVCRFLRAAVAAIAVMMILWLIPLSAKAEAPYILTGRVTDSLTEAGMSGARITFSRSGFLQSATCDGDGFYRIELPLFGFYNYSTSKLSYKQVNGQIFMDGDKTENISIAPAITPAITAPNAIDTGAGVDTTFELQCKNSVYSTKIKAEITGVWKADNAVIDGTALSFDGDKLIGWVEPTFEAEFSPYGPDQYLFKFYLIDTATGAVLATDETPVSVSGTTFLEPLVSISDLPDQAYTGSELGFSVSTVSGSVYYDNTRLELFISDIDDPSGLSLSLDDDSIDLEPDDGGVLGIAGPKSGEPLLDSTRNFVLKFNTGFAGSRNVIVRLVNLDDETVLAYDEKLIDVLETEEPPDDDPEIPEEPGDDDGGDTEEPGDESDPSEDPDDSGTGDGNDDPGDEDNPTEPGDEEEPEEPGDDDDNNGNDDNNDNDEPDDGDDESGDPDEGDNPADPETPPAPVDKPGSRRNRNDIRLKADGPSAVVALSSQSYTKMENGRIYKITSSRLREILSYNKKHELGNIIFDTKNSLSNKNNTVAGISFDSKSARLLISHNTDISLRFDDVTVRVPSSAIEMREESEKTSLTDKSDDRLIIAIKREPLQNALSEDHSARENKDMYAGFEVMSNITRPVEIMIQLRDQASEGAVSNSVNSQLHWGVWRIGATGINEFIPGTQSTPFLRIRTVPNGRFMPGAVAADSVRG
jgi:hypothetical protein